MPLKNNMTLDEVKDYLINDLKKSVEDDVYPAISPRRKRGGYFAVPRLVFSYIDYLGALYHGYKPPVRGTSGRVSIAKSDYAIEFLKIIMNKVHENYRIYAELMYNMYRHGTVHLYQPKTLVRTNGDTITWLSYKGDRMQNIGIPGISQKVVHLRPAKVAKSQWVLPVSLNCLYEDLRSGMEIFAREIEKDPKLLARFVSAANEIIKHEQTTLTW